jgi:hypothetical protein
MGKRPKKKIVLFLVEGKSDRELLQAAISSLYERINDEIVVYFPLICDDNLEKGGDVTSEFGAKPSNIESRIYDRFLRNFFDREKIMPKDIIEVIQIIDTDGVFIPESSIEENPNPLGLPGFYYANDRIITENPQYAIDRNRRKSENVKYLVSLDKIKIKQKSVKYGVYYFSCNLDHYFHQDPNLPYNEKRRLAELLASYYADDVDGFVKLICNDEFASRHEDYRESWAYIMDELHSLSCHTNLNLLLNRLVAERECS